MKKIISLVLILVIFIVVFLLYKSPTLFKSEGDIMKTERADLIRLDAPQPNETVSSPFVVKGEARGNWFFEADFPVFVTNWDGLIIGQGIATAQGEWMTTDFVPFIATISYTLDKDSYSNRGTLILQKDNPSDLPEHDDALEIPIMLTPSFK